MEAELHTKLYFYQSTHIIIHLVWLEIYKSMDENTSKEIMQTFMAKNMRGVLESGSMLIKMLSLPPQCTQKLQPLRFVVPEVFVGAMILLGVTI